MIFVQLQACEEASKTTAQTLRSIVRSVSRPKEMPSCAIERSAKIEVRHSCWNHRVIRALQGNTSCSSLNCDHSRVDV